MEKKAKMKIGFLVLLLTLLSITAFMAYPAVAPAPLNVQYSLITEPVVGVAHTPQCLVECHLPLRITFGQDYTVSNGIDFSPRLVDGSGDYDFDSLEFRRLVTVKEEHQDWVPDVSCSPLEEQLPANETHPKEDILVYDNCVDNGHYETRYATHDEWQPFSPKDFIFEANTDYLVDLVGKRKARIGSSEVDAQFCFGSKCTTEYAWWNTDYEYKYNLTPSVTGRDTIPPAYSSAHNETNTSFDPNSPVRINLSWTDNFNLSGVSIEVNRSGTVTLYQAGNVTAAVWNLTLPHFPAGTHYWRSNATDSTGNTNTTGWHAFTIAKASPTLNLSLNGSEAALTMDEDTAVVLNGSLTTGDSGATLTMAIDGASYLSGTGLRNETVFATPGTYNISLSYMATQNYSASGNKSYLLTVADITYPTYTVPLNVTPATFNKAHTLNFTINWTDNFNLSTVWFEVNRSGTLILYTATNQTAGRTSASTLWNLTLSDFPAGTHSWRSNASDSAGNTNTTGWYAFTITKAAPTLALTLNGTAGNVTIAQASSIWLNGSVTAGDSGALIETFLDGAEISVGTAVANLTNFTSVGLFNITLYYTETGNYTTTTVAYFVTVVDVTVPIVSAHTPTGTVTSSSTTLTATTDENSTCRYSTAAGTAYASMASVMSGNTTTHTASLTGLSTGTYNYYIRCNNTAGLVATTDYNATITVSISSGGGGSGGSTVATDTTPTMTKVISSVSKDTGIEMSISKATIPVETITVAVTESATNVEITVTATDTKPETVAEAPRSSGGAERTVYKYLDISQTNLAGKIASATIDFKVTKAWLDNNSADKTQIVLQRHTGTSWEELPTEITKETTANVYYSATTTGFSVFAIAVKEKAAAEPEAEPGEQPGEQQPGEQQGEPPGEGPEEQPPAEPARKGIFQSTLFTIAAATVLATTGIGFIYRNRLTLGARIDDLLELLRRRREQRGKRR